jgi:hypothetical protein
LVNAFFSIGGENQGQVWNARMSGDGDDVTMRQGANIFSADRLSGTAPPKKQSFIKLCL